MTTLASHYVALIRFLDTTPYVDKQNIHFVQSVSPHPPQVDDKNKNKLYFPPYDIYTNIWQLNCKEIIMKIGWGRGGAARNNW